MPTYSKKPDIVEAIQFDGTLLGVGEVLKFMGKQKVLPVTLHNSDGSKSILLPVGRVLKPTDFVVRHMSGTYEPWRKELFLDVYEARSTVDEDPYLDAVAEFRA